MKRGHNRNKQFEKERACRSKKDRTAIGQRISKSSPIVNQKSLKDLQINMRKEGGEERGRCTNLPLDPLL